MHFSKKRFLLIFEKNHRFSKELSGNKFKSWRPHILDSSHLYIHALTPVENRICFLKKLILGGDDCHYRKKLIWKYPGTIRVKGQVQTRQAFKTKQVRFSNRSYEARFGEREGVILAKMPLVVRHIFFVYYENQPLKSF